MSYQIASILFHIYTNLAQTGYAMLVLLFYINTNSSQGLAEISSASKSRLMDSAD